jgi:hypothetical protein
METATRGRWFRIRHAIPSPVVVLRSLPRGRNGDNRSTPPSSPAIELTAIRLEGCPLTRPGGGAARKPRRSRFNERSRRGGSRGERNRPPRETGSLLSTRARFRSSSIDRPASGTLVSVAEEVDQDPSTSSMALAYKDPSLQKLRVSMNTPSCGMMAPAATGAVVRAYEPLNL